MPPRLNRNLPVVPAERPNRPLPLGKPTPVSRPASIQLSKPEPPSPDWFPGKVTMQTFDGTNKVDAFLYGGMAVYPAWEERFKGKWSVGCAGCGLRVALVNTEECAKQIGEYLWDRFCLAMRCKTKEEVNERLPPWVKPWCKEMENTGVWINPESFSRRG